MSAVDVAYILSLGSVKANANTEPSEEPLGCVSFSCHCVDEFRCSVVV